MMFKKQNALFVITVLSFTLFVSESFAKNKHGRNDRNGNYQQENQEGYYDKPIANENAADADLVRAAESRRRVNFAEGAGMVVTKLLPDDNSGLRHQKWVVRLSNGMQMQAVYNLDMCDKVPLKVGDTVAMGGQFIWTNQGAMLHWLHHDPRGNRPDGYVQLNGKFYCKE